MQVSLLGHFANTDTFRPTLRETFTLQSTFGKGTVGQPLSLAINHAGEIFVGDAWSATIHKYQANGQYLGIFTEVQENAGDHLAAAMVFNHDDDLISVQTFQTRKVKVYGPTGNEKVKNRPFSKFLTLLVPKHFLL